MPREKDGFVYLMTDNQDRVKIGTSINIMTRYRALKISNPDLKIFGKIPTRKYISLETFLHQQLAKHNVGGEWFSPADEVITKVFNIILLNGQRFGAFYVVTGNIEF